MVLEQTLPSGWRHGGTAHCDRPGARGSVLRHGAPDAVFIPSSSARKWSAAQFEALGSVVLGAPERLLHGPVLEKA